MGGVGKRGKGTATRKERTGDEAPGGDARAGPLRRKCVRDPSSGGRAMPALSLALWSVELRLRALAGWPTVLFTCAAALSSGARRARREAGLLRRARGAPRAPRAARSGRGHRGDDRARRRRAGHLAGLRDRRGERVRGVVRGGGAGSRRVERGARRGRRRGAPGRLPRRAVRRRRARPCAPRRPPPSPPTRRGALRSAGLRWTCGRSSGSCTRRTARAIGRWRSPSRPHARRVRARRPGGRRRARWRCSCTAPTGRTRGCTGA